MTKTIQAAFGQLLVSSVLLLSACSGKGKNEKIDLFDIASVNSGKCFFFDKNEADRYIKMGDFPCLKKALENGLDPNAVKKDDFFKTETTYLELAISDSALFFGQSSKMSGGALALLLNYGGDVNTSFKGTTLVEKTMRLDAKYHDVALYVMRFRSARSNFDANKLSSGGTPLEIAINVKSDAFVAELLQNGAKPNEQTRGVTPLIQALQSGLEASALSLINAGANVNVSSSQQSPSLVVAMGQQLKTAFDRILGATNLIDQTNDAGDTALLIASRLQDKSYFDKLLPRSNALDAQDGTKKSAIFYLVQDSDLDRVQKMFARGARVDLLASDSSSLLHLAKSAPLVEFLLDTGKSNVDGLSKQDRTPLAVAVDNQNLAVTRVLLARGANRNFTYPNGDTLLHVAVRNDDIATTRFLLQNSLGVEALNRAGETPVFGIASIDVARVLNDAGANFLREGSKKRHLLMALFSRQLPSVELLRYLLAKGLTPDQDVKIGFYPLHTVLSYANTTNRETAVSLFDVLLGAGADINRVNQQGLPVLHRATDLDWIKYLADRGANLSIRGLGGRTLMQNTELQIASLEEQIALLKNEKDSQTLVRLRRDLAKQLEIQAYLVEKGAVVRPAGGSGKAKAIR